MKSKKYFGTDGVRGVANIDLTAELAMKLGAAAAKVTAGPIGKLRVAICRDTRRSGTMLEAALSAGLSSMGAEVSLLGVAPTPAVSYMTAQGDFDLGVAISASHNPARDNGIKFFGSDGKKLPDSVEIEIERVLTSGEAKHPPMNTEPGFIHQLASPVQHYKAFLKAIAEHPLDGLRIVIDGANGAAYEIGPELVRAAGAEVIPINCEPNGDNINKQCGSTSPAQMQSAVVEHKANLGAAFDGDADRVILADENGNLVDGDRIIAMWILHKKQNNMLKHPVAVGTVMSNMGFEKALKDNGITLIRAQVGDRYVAEAMLEHKAIIGGEQSGHIIFAEKCPTGDGILTLMETLQIIQKTGKPLSELAHSFEPWPQRLVNIKIRQRDGWNENPAVAQAITQAEQLIGNQGRLNIRPSGTEPLLRVMAEAVSIELMEQTLNCILPVLQKELDGTIHSVTELSNVNGN